MAYLSTESFMTAAQGREKLDALEAKYNIPSLRFDEIEGRRVSRALGWGNAAFIAFEEGGYYGVKVESWNEGNLDYAQATFPQLVSLGLVSKDDSLAYDKALDLVRQHEAASKQNVQFNQLLASLGKDKMREMLNSSK